MKCERAERLMNRSLDRQAGPMEERILAAHLASCQACRERQAGLIDLGRRLARPDSLDPPPVSLAARILAQAGPVLAEHRRAAAADPGWGQWWRLAAWPRRVAAAAALGGVGLLGGLVGLDLGPAGPAGAADRLAGAAQPGETDFQDPFRLLPDTSWGRAYLDVMDELGGQP